LRSARLPATRSSAPARVQREGAPWHPSLLPPAPGCKGSQTGGRGPTRTRAVADQTRAEGYEWTGVPDAAGLAAVSDGGATGSLPASAMSTTRTPLGNLAAGSAPPKGSRRPHAVRTYLEPEASASNAIARSVRLSST